MEHVSLSHSTTFMNMDVIYRFCSTLCMKKVNLPPCRCGWSCTQSYRLTCASQLCLVSEPILIISSKLQKPNVAKKWQYHPKLYKKKTNDSFKNFRSKWIYSTGSIQILRRKPESAVPWWKESNKRDIKRKEFWSQTWYYLWRVCNSSLRRQQVSFFGCGQR